VMRAKRSTIAVGFGNQAQWDWWKAVPSNCAQNFWVETRVVPREHFFNLGAHRPNSAQLGEELRQRARAELMQPCDRALEPDIRNLFDLSLFAKAQRSFRF